MAIAAETKARGAKGYIAQFDMKSGKKSGGLLFFGKSKNKKAKEGDLTGFKLANGKTDWAKILDRTLGPRRVAYRPLQVGLGKPTSSPVVSASVVVEDVPVPTPNPVRRAEIQVRNKLNGVGLSDPGIAQTAANAAIPATGSAAQAAVGSSAAEGVNKAAHGSLFRKGLDFSVPVPGANPNR